MQRRNSYSGTQHHLFNQNRTDHLAAYTWSTVSHRLSNSRRRLHFAFVRVEGHSSVESKKPLVTTNHIIERWIKSSLLICICDRLPVDDIEWVVNPLMRLNAVSFECTETLSSYSDSECVDMVPRLLSSN